MMIMEALSTLNNQLPNQDRIDLGILPKVSGNGHWFVVVLRMCALGAIVGGIAAAVSAQFVLIAPCVILCALSLISSYYVSKLARLESQQRMLNTLNQMTNKIVTFVEQMNSQIRKLDVDNKEFKKNNLLYQQISEERNKRIQEHLREIEDLNKKLDFSAKKIENYELINEKLNQTTGHFSDLVKKFVQTESILDNNMENFSKEEGEFDQDLCHLSVENKELKKSVVDLTHQVEQITKMVDLVEEYFMKLAKLNHQQDRSIKILDDIDNNFLKGAERYQENLQSQKQLQEELGVLLNKHQRKPSIEIEDVEKNKKEKLKKEKSMVFSHFFHYKNLSTSTKGIEHGSNDN